MLFSLKQENGYNDLYSSDFLLWQWKLYDVKDYFFYWFD